MSAKGHARGRQTGKQAAGRKDPVIQSYDRTSSTGQENMSKIKCTAGNCGGCGYIVAFIGAAAYYISSTVGFGAGVVGVLKAIVWPGFLVFELLKFIGA